MQNYMGLRPHDLDIVLTVDFETMRNNMGLRRTYGVINILECFGTMWNYMSLRHNLNYKLDNKPKIK